MRSSARAPSQAKAEVKDAAREAESSHGVHALARAGYAANGFVHILVAAIILVVAFGGHGETDQTGALKAVASAPWGFLALWALAVALLGLGAYHLLDGIVGWGGDSGKKWARRISEWSQSVVFIALGLLAASVALGAKPDADKSAEVASRDLLAIPGGPVVLWLVGAGIGVAGIAFVVMGVRRSFEKRVSVPDGGLGVMIKTLGIVGFVAKGIALVVLAILVVVAAVRDSPKAAGGLDAAIDALVERPYGPPLVGAVGVGLVAYGVFCFFRARYAKLSEP